MDLAEFNTAPRQSARDLLEACADIESWVQGLLDGRPYGDLTALLQRADTLAQGWTPDQVDAALASRPRIGQTSTSSGVEASMSVSEQAGIGPDVDLAQALHEANVAYEKRFGRVFLTAAQDRSGQEILTELQQRLEAEPGDEAAATADELRRIATLRLRQSLS